VACDADDYKVPGLLGSAFEVAGFVVENIGPFIGDS